MTTTPAQLRHLAQDAHEAMQEAIAREGRIRMTIPADPANDTDLRIAALTEAADAAADQLEAVHAIVQQLSHATPRRLLEEALGLTADTALTTPPIPVGLCGAGGCVFKEGHESEHSWGGAS